MTNPLEDNAVVQLGFVTLNPECQAQIETLNSAEKGIRPEEQPPQIVEEKTDWTLYIIGGGAAIVIIAIIIIIVVVKKK